MVEIKRRLQKIRDSVALFGYKVEAQQGELETFAIGIALGMSASESYCTPVRGLYSRGMSLKRRNRDAILRPGFFVLVFLTRP